MAKLRVSSTVASAIETEAIDGGADGDEYQAIRAAWDGSALTVPADPFPLWREINELSNHLDGVSREPTSSMSDDERRFCRRASEGLSRLLGRLTASRSPR